MLSCEAVQDLLPTGYEATKNGDEIVIRRGRSVAARISDKKGLEVKYTRGDYAWDLASILDPTSGPLFNLLQQLVVTS